MSEIEETGNLRQEHRAARQQIIAGGQQQLQNQDQGIYRQYRVVDQQQLEHMTPYARFINDLAPLPPQAVRGGQVQAEPKVGYKERKRREEAYNQKGDELLENPRLMRQALEEGKYPHFEKMDGIMRNMLARKALDRLNHDYDINEQSNSADICEQIKQNGGVRALLDPALRLSLSLARRADGVSDNLKEF